MIDEFKVIVNIPVAWGEMDSLGHVNNTCYFRYFESARIEYFKRIGFWGSGKIDPIAPILAATDCQFIFPLTYPDIIKSCVKITEVRNTSFIMQHAIFSEDGRLAAKGSGVGVCYNYSSNEKEPIPAEIKTAISELEGIDF